ncbi:hypothetical protein H5410_036485 [Solanum commersonii]|uniref:DUF4283 domain-containing protein n=1 Tax=Solanum commersonii TaxID=4109 RepID=A0A9J5Y4Y7_SOLCO|nr:hypothetical protein H5410_036485 [Solanum commersonii]
MEIDDRVPIQMINTMAVDTTVEDINARATNSQRKKSNEADIQASKDSHANSNRDAINLSSSETHSNDNAKGQKLIKLNDRERAGTSNPNNMGIKIKIGLRQIHATQATNIELVPPRHMTKQGQPAVIYDMDDFMNKLTVDCKYTLIGKFSTTMPKIELIRKSFILQTQLNGGVNIAHYNARHVFIDLYNELDYNTVWTQQRMTIEGKLMRIQAWTPKFRPEEETPIVPIWLLIAYRAIKLSRKNSLHPF